jgi:hypothetical protein
MNQNFTYSVQIESSNYEKVIVTNESFLDDTYVPNWYGHHYNWIDHWVQTDH